MLFQQQWHLSTWHLREHDLLGAFSLERPEGGRRNERETFSVRKGDQNNVEQAAQRHHILLMCETIPMRYFVSRLHSIYLEREMKVDDAKSTKRADGVV